MKQNLPKQLSKSTLLWMKKGIYNLSLAFESVSESHVQRIQVLVQRNEGFEGSAGIDSCGSDHGGQNFHVHNGTVKQWTKEWHL